MPCVHRLRGFLRQHCYVGGASEGLGLALACILVQRGAHVTIVSRNQDKLDKALIELEVRALVQLILRRQQR